MNSSSSRMSSLRIPLFLQFESTAEGYLRAALVLFLAVLVFHYSTVFEKEYNATLLDLYTYPWWRFLLVFLMITATLWCPRVGIVMALLVFLYLSDMSVLLVPLNERT